MSNAQGSAAIQEMVARLRGLADLPKQLAPMVADEMKSYFRANIRAGVSPEGAAWPPRKKDGAPALQNADKAISTQAVGSTAIATLHSPEAFHHFGAGASPERGIFPKGALPAKLGEAIRQGAIIGWQSLVKRGRGKKGGKR